MFFNLSRAAHRAVCERPQSGLTLSRSAGIERETAANPLGNDLGRLDVVVLDIDDTNTNVLGRADLADELELGELPTRHLNVNLVGRQREERRKHRGVATRGDRPALEIAEAEMRPEVAAVDDRPHGSIEDVDQAIDVLAIGITAHRRLIDGDHTAAGVDEPHQLVTHDRQQRFSDCISVGIVAIGVEPARQRVRAGNARLETWP